MLYNGTEIETTVQQESKYFFTSQSCSSEHIDWVFIMILGSWLGGAFQKEGNINN